VTLAVTGNTISGRVVWRQRVLVSREHRLSFRPEVDGHTVAERSWKDADFVCIPVFSVAVMEKCCDACGDGEYYFRSSCLASEGADVSRWHRLPLTGNRWDILWLSGRGKTPTLCVFPVFSVAVMEKCCDPCGDGEYYFRSGCLASE
jgi:hypothetical protein